MPVVDDTNAGGKRMVVANDVILRDSCARTVSQRQRAVAVPNRVVVNQVVADEIVAALPHKDPRRMPVDLADVMNVVSGNFVLAVDILGAGPVAA